MIIAPCLISLLVFWIFSWYYWFPVMLFMCCNILSRKLLKCTQSHKAKYFLLCVCMCDSVFLLKMHVIYESYALQFEVHRLLPEVIRPLSRAWHLLSTALLRKLNAMFFLWQLLSVMSGFTTSDGQTFTTEWSLKIYVRHRNLTSEFVILGTVITLTMFL